MNFLVGALASGALSGNGQQAQQASAPQADTSAPDAGGQGSKSSADAVGDVVNSSLGEQEEEA